MAYLMSQWLLNLTKSGDFAYCEPRTTFVIQFSCYSALILAIGYEVKGGFRTHAEEMQAGANISHSWNTSMTN